MSTEPRCPDCNQAMEKGFIPDFGYGTSSHSVVQTMWHPGEAEDRLLLGLKTGTVKIEKSAARRIISYCCPVCGLLRSYAEKAP
jgi:hypothetical protein